MSTSAKNSHHVSNRDNTGFLGHQVDAENNPVFPLAVSCQGAQGFFGFTGSRFLINGGDAAPGAKAGKPVHRFPDGKFLPAVLGKRVASVHHQVGPEPVHGQRCVEPGIQVSQGCGGYQEAWIAVGEAHGFTRAAFRGRNGPHAGIIHVGHTAFLAQVLGDPGVAFPGNRRGIDPVPPHCNFDSPAPVGEFQVQEVLAWGGKFELGSLETPGQERQTGMGSLAQEMALFIDDHPPPVMAQALGFHPGPGRCHTTDTLDRVEVDGGKADIHVTFSADREFVPRRPPA